MSGGGGDGGTDFPTNPWADAPGGRPGEIGTGPGGRGPGSGSGTTDTCADLTIDARLRNVDVDELMHVTVGDILAVIYQPDPAPMVAVVRILNDGTLSPRPVGALLDRLSELLPCLEVLTFEAEVTVVNGGNTRVQIRPASA